MIGYSKPLYILPFDHRGSFVKGLFGDSENNNERIYDSFIADKVKEFKMLIYEAFIKAVEESVPREGAAILVDEEYGEKILIDAAEKGFITILTTEKTGQDVFDFQYGNEFGQHLLKLSPTFAKALVRYNPEEGGDKNRIQLERLKLLSDFCHERSIKLLIEPLIMPTSEELEKVHGDKTLFDRELRPELMVEMIKEFQDAGVEPDIWKIEGLSDPMEYYHVISQARSNGRDNVSVVILGRGESREKVEEWIKAGRNVKGVVGFAVGRTIFWDPLINFKNEKISREEAILKIAKNYIYFYELFTGKR